VGRACKRAAHQNADEVLPLGRAAEPASAPQGKKR
jgi:hypothetical protein